MKTESGFRLISWVAEKYDVHPQTLRVWEREGLLRPTRSEGNTRLYDEAACERLEMIITLTRDLGVNLAGVEIILNLQDQVKKLQSDIKMVSRVLDKVHKESRAPRNHALVKVQSGAILPVEQPVEGE